MNSAGFPHLKANVAPPRRKLWPEKSWGLKEAREAKCLMPSLRDLAVMQSNWLVVVVNVKRGYLAGAETVRSNEWSANVGKRGDPGIRGTGTTRAVSPDWRVFDRLTVRRAPELVNVTLPLDNAVCEEKVSSSERGTRLAALINVKKPT